jgi:hypothetical protein
MVTVEQFIERYPRLWHMAERGSWPLIERFGLLSTSALLDLFEVSGSARFALESEFRPKSVPIRHVEHGVAVVRDQKPMISDEVVARYVDEMTPREWYETLNKRVFFWVSEARLDRFLGARPYKDRVHTVLVADTAALFADHMDRVSLSPINSGAIFPQGTTRRGNYTFKRFRDYDWEDRLRRPEPVVELAVDRGVPNIVDLLVDRSDRRAVDQSGRFTDET